MLVLNMRNNIDLAKAEVNGKLCLPLTYQACEVDHVMQRYMAANYCPQRWTHVIALST